MMTLENCIAGMDACRASNYCHGARSAPWTAAAPAALSAKAARPARVRAAAPAARAARAHPPPWLSWTSNPRRRHTRPSTPSMRGPSPLSTTNLSICSTGFPLTGKTLTIGFQIKKNEKVLLDSNKNRASGNSDWLGFQLLRLVNHSSRVTFHFFHFFSYRW